MRIALLHTLSVMTLVVFVFVDVNVHTSALPGECVFTPSPWKEAKPVQIEYWTLRHCLAARSCI
jgi:hypothetical protein